MKNLIKSYKFWTALAGAVGMLIMGFNTTFGININVEGVRECIMAFCGVLIVFGVVKKPAGTKEDSQPQEISLNKEENSTLGVSHNAEQNTKD